MKHHRSPGPVEASAILSNRAVTVAAALAAAALMMLTVVTLAHAERDFGQRYGENTRGNITMAANSLTTCAASVSVCAQKQAGTSTNNDNGGFLPAFIDVDGDPTTKNSSKATLNLPAGAEIRFAGLYWGGRPELEPTGSQPNVTKAEFGEVKLAAPGGSGYQTVTASEIDDVVFGVNTNATWQAFADVTAIVQAAGGGEYTVGGVRVEGERSTSNGSWSGWSLVVAYSHPAEPWRNLVVYDGLKGVLAGGPSVDIPLSGFLTPPAPANVNTTFGVVAYEGDRGTSNDRMRVIQEGDEVLLKDAVTSENNFFNSSITREGVDVGDRTPAYPNQLGYDAKLVKAQNALKNSTTSATVRVSTGGDGIAAGVISAATELFVPDVTLTKGVENLTDPGAPIAHPGDVLEYTITAENETATPTAPVDSAGSFVLSDPIPAGTTYVPGSLALTAGPNAPATPSDTAGDDVGEFNGGAEEVVFRLGTGANGTSGGTLAPGETTTARFKVEIDADFNGGPIDNEALADYRAVTLDQPLQETAEVSLLSEPLSDLEIVKSASPAQVEAGDQLTYTLKVDNHGPSASDPTIVTDTLPAGLNYVSDDSGCDTSALPLIECNLGVIASGSSETIEIVTEVEPSASGTYVENTAEVSGPNPETDMANNKSTAKTPVLPFSDLSIVKTASAPSAKPGEEVSYTLEVENAGVSTSDPTTVTDTLPAGLEYLSDDAACDTSALPLIECDVGSLAEGGTATIELVTKVLAVTGTIENTAEVSGPNPDPEPDNNESTASTAIEPVSDLRIAKTASAPSVQPGQQLTYTLEVENLGPSASSPTTIADTLPAGLTYVSDDASCETTALPEIICSVGSLASGESKEVHLVVEVDPSASGTIENTAEVSGPNHDPDLGNNESTASTAIEPVSDLRIAKTASALSASPGQQLTYTLEVENAGVSTSDPTTVTDTLPAGLEYLSDDAACDTSALPLIECDVGSLAEGGTATIELVTKVLAVTGTIENTAEVSGPNPDPEPDNNESTASTAIEPVSDLRIDKSVDRIVTKEGETLTYTLAVENKGPSDSESTTVTDTLPPGLTHVSSDAGCDTAALPTISCDLGTVPNGAIATIQIVAKVTPGASGTIDNTAAVSGSNSDPTPADNLDSVSTSVEPTPAPPKPQDPPAEPQQPQAPKDPNEPKGSAKKPRLVVEKRASSANARPGSVIGYRITVRNAGNGPARKVKVCDHPPAGQRTLRTEPRATGKAEPCWSLPKLPAGAKRTFKLTAIVDTSSDGGTQRNTVTVAAANAKNVSRDAAAVRVKPLPNTGCLAGSSSLPDIRFLC